ncbi:hypothetical protein [Mangrovihabitans endophyticus]|uniref:WXG100 family type VII secretion target n=1 Tax=Mangrovihabitans endophyticus TaxID=1751298 RepID=A0A8J3BX92_9ACTN|nr:hypothetical protein [Mangrovihabitans endophyticus]GGK78760.1 hypothetical protein GCM10012284_10830 [Mangrovihabitans endophyticus]
MDRAFQGLLDSTPSGTFPDNPSPRSWEKEGGPASWETKSSPPWLPPSNYNAAGTHITVDPKQMWQHSSLGMELMIVQIVDSWRAISHAWQDLKLDWVGGSAETAKEFFSDLEQVQAKFFGSKARGADDGETGVLGEVQSAVELASANYDNAEQHVTEMFQQLMKALNAHGGGSGSPAPKDDVDGPIAVRYDNGPNVVSYSVGKNGK